MSKSKLIAEQIKRIRPLLKEANPQQKLKLMKLMKVALKENFDERMALIRKLVRTGEYDASDLELASTEELEQLLADQHGIDESEVHNLQSVDPEDHGETEGSFTKNQIQTMIRVLSHLENAIGDNEDLPEWVQMLLSQSQEKVVGVMDYMISAKELEAEQQTGNQSIMTELSMMEGKVRTPKKKKVKESNDFLQEK